MQAGMVAAQMASAGEKYADLMVGAAVIGAQLVNTKYGRNAELESDKYGMKYMVRAGYDPREAVALQQTFVRLSKGRKSDWLEGLFASHPPSQERVDANQKYADKLPRGLKTGQQEYQQRIAGLKATKQAYADYDAGLKALTEGDANRALVLAEKAIRQDDREALFYGLRGDALLKTGKIRQANRAFNEAIKRNDSFFAFYLQRGIIEQKLKNETRARADFEYSLKLMPTATAHYALGNMALNTRDEKNAIKHYRAAAGSSSPLGKKAAVSLALLELPQDPGKYISVSSGLDNKGRVMVQISNRSPVAVNRVVLEIRHRSGKTDKIPVNDTIPAGKSTTIRLPKSGGDIRAGIIYAAPVR